MALEVELSVTSFVTGANSADEEVGMGGGGGSGEAGLRLSGGSCVEPGAMASARGAVVLLAPFIAAAEGFAAALEVGGLAPWEGSRMNWRCV